MKLLNTLHPVRVTKRDTCLTYAYRRTGHSVYPVKYAKDIPKEALMPFRLDTLTIGQIVAWKSRKSYYLWNTEITSSFNGRPVLIKNLEFAGLHFAVIEDIIIKDEDTIIIYSDCVRNKNDHSFPTIELQSITINEHIDINTIKLPTYTLNLTKLKELK